MSQFTSPILTRKGKDLLAKAQNSVPLQFSKVVLGDGTLPENQDVEALEVVLNAMMDASIESISNLGDGTSQIRFVLENQYLNDGFFVREMGLMAIDPDEGEILYSYTNAGSTADFIPSNGGATVVEQQIDLITIVGNAANVTAVLSPAVRALKEDVDNHDADPDAHAGRLGAIEDSIRLKEEYAPHQVQLELFSAGHTLFDSTAWEVDQASGQAVAVDGGIYEVYGLSVHDLSQDKAAVVRRTNNDGILNAFYRDATHSEWTEAPWAWQREVDDDFIDVEYQVPARGIFDMRFESVAGPSAVDPMIDHKIFIECESGQGGTHRPPDTPSIVSPVDGATGIMEQPSLTTGEFVSPTGDSLQGTWFQISTTVDFTEDNIIADSGIMPGVSWSPDKGILAVETSYYVRALHVDVDGGTSEWSPAVSFTMATAFVSVDKPTCTSPAAGDELGNPDGLILISSAFAVTGDDTHQSSQWQVSSDPAFTTVLHDSGTDTTNLTSYNVPDSTVERGNSYYWRVRHEGTTGSWSDWSLATEFSVMTMTILEAGATLSGGTVDDDGMGVVWDTPGIYSFTIPDGVFLLSGVVVGPGGSGATSEYVIGAGGGGGGGLQYKNDIPVYPGNIVTVVVTAGGSETDSSFTISVDIVSIVGGAGENGRNSDGYEAAGGTGSGGDGGCNGGKGGEQVRGGPYGGGSGGGAGGYKSDGGDGACHGGLGLPSDDGGDGGGGSDTQYQGGGGGGGVGLYGSVSASGGYTAKHEGGDGGSGGDAGGEGLYDRSGGKYGGGGGSTGGSPENNNFEGGTGGNGAVRLIWGPENTRSFPDAADLFVW